MGCNWNLAAGLLALGGLCAGAAAEAKDYLIVGSKPNALFVVDAAARKVVHSYTIPGEGSPYTI